VLGAKVSRFIGGNESKSGEVKMPSQPAQHSTFAGTQVRFDSDLAFDEVLANLRSLVGQPTIEDLAKLESEPSTQAEFASKIRGYIGKSEFMLFLQLDHGAWMEKFGVKRRVLRWILGNPLIAITMIRPDVTSGLFVPVELLLVDGESGKGSSVIYVLPSSLMAIEQNAALREAALALDAKLDSLVAKAVGAKA
jgi:hypothetical protein